MPYSRAESSSRTHTHRGDKYVTVIIDLTGIREDTGSARLLDMVEGARRR
ncbi:hypothetical protein [Streptomyces sp. DSM 41534]